MCAMRRALLLVTTVFWLLSFPAFGQNSPSLGDAARSTRQQEQEKDQPGKGPSAGPKAARVVTDDDTPPRAGAPDQPSKSSDQQQASKNGSPAAVAKLTAEQWKAKILAQKSGINAMQSQIDKVKDSIHFVAATCRGCEQWNERQLQKKQEVERALAELEKQKKLLEEMQEAARQQGYGSSVYDP